MRLTGPETISAAFDAGLRVFDTAHAYGESPGENERLLAGALKNRPDAFVITKGGMLRPEGGWRSDGRGQTVRRDAEQGAQALGRPADLFLIHAPDPRVPWATTVRALAKVMHDGLARSVGLSNVSLRQLDEALELAPIEAVQLAWNALDDSAVRSGVLARCLEKKLAVIAHSPLGGPNRVAKLLQLPALLEVAQRHHVSTAVVALSALLDLHPSVFVIPGARSPQAARDVALAAELMLTDPDRATLHSVPALAPIRVSKVRGPPTAEGEVVLLMGVQGAGKSTLAREWIERGYENLNRDTLGKGLKEVAKRADQKLSDGVRRLVLDNTYVSRPSRAEILDVAAKHGVAARGIWVDVPLHEAKVNVVWRMLDTHGRLLSPAELKKGRDNASIPPMALMRMVKELELPSLEEGFTALETRAFVRTPREGAVGRFVALEAREKVEASELPTLIFGWQAEAIEGASLCLHGDGPPSCWCRPPLPGLLLAFAHAHRLDPSRCELHGTNQTHRTMAEAIGARFIQR
jgi:aryl-alcohol dehydrogenase-like predicted oxidoreductase/predicted kinase